LIEHIVMWRFKPENKAQNMARLQQMLEALPESIPWLRSLSVGAHAHPTAPGWDMALVIRVDSWDDLAAYTAHPAHKAVSDFCKGIREDRAVVDRMI
jgi:hypothetical protein